MERSEFDAWKEFFMTVYEMTEEDSKEMAARMCVRCKTWEEIPNTKEHEPMN